MLEVECKYEVPADFVLPSLRRPGWVVTDGGTVQLSATYYDTADLRLAGARTTLRRRTGGKDAGWHLKVPSGADREELARPLGDTNTVPAELAAQVELHTHGAALAPVARLDTTRTIRTVSATDGTVLVEVVNDFVHVQRLGSEGPPHEWREVEAELLTPAHEDALAEVGQLLLEAGAVPSRHASKLAQALDTG